MSLVFLQSEAPTGLTKQQRNIQRARIRAHAARLSHSRWDAEYGVSSDSAVVDEPQVTGHGNSQSPKPRRTRVVRYAHRPQLMTACLPLSPESVRMSNDPFDSFAPTVIPDRAFTILRFVGGVASVNIDCVDPTPDVRKAYQQAVLKQLLTVRGHAIHTAIASGAQQLKLLLPSAYEAKLDSMILQHRSEAIRLVRSRVEQGEFADPELYSVLALAINGLYARKAHDLSFPLSPLATAQDIHLYGQAFLDASTTNVWLSMSDNLGGPLSAAAEFGDLLIATRTFLRPRFSQTWPSNWSITTDSGYRLDHIAQQLKSVQGSSLLALSFLSRTYRLVIQHMIEITAALDHYSRAAIGCPQKSVLVNARNRIQHHLLSLPALMTGSRELGNDLWHRNPTSLESCETHPVLVDAEDVSYCSPNSTVESHLLEAVRITLLIYSDLTLFPLPPSAEVRPTLARKLARLLPLLKDVREHCSVQHDAIETHDACDVMTWILTIGGIAAHRDPRLVRVLGQYFRPFAQSSLSIQTFSGDDGSANGLLGHLEAIMSRYLWWGPACNPPARDFWLGVLA